MAQKVTIEFFDSEYSFPIPTDDGYKAFFSDNLMETEDKARAVYGDDIEIEVINIED